MMTIRDGQCGMCVHFGEEHPRAQELVRIRRQGQAPEDLRETCGHPQHSGLHLVVTPISGCDGFEPALKG